jgi:hypothetical protein
MICPSNRVQLKNSPKGRVARKILEAKKVKLTNASHWRQAKKNLAKRPSGEKQAVNLGI